MAVQKKVEMDKDGLVDCPVCDGKGSRMFRGKYSISCNLCKGAKRILKWNIPKEEEIELKRKGFLEGEYGRNN